MATNAPLLPTTASDEEVEGGIWRRTMRTLPGGLGALLVGLGVCAVVSLGVSSLSPAPLPKSTRLSAASKYTKVQYLGFQIFTPPGTSADGCFSDGNDLNEDCYLGSRHVTKDLKARLDIMRTAVENAYASPDWDRSPSTLKVFSAPEFYWRGARGAYRLQLKAKLLDETFAVELEEFAKQPKFADWLFIFGTAILAEPVDASWAELVNHPYANIVYYNVAPIYIGGTTRKLLEFKHYISGEDFIQHSPGHPRVHPIQSPPGSATEFCKTHENSNGCFYGGVPERVARQIGFHAYEIIHNNIFELEGLRVGIEICLDHGEGRLVSRLGPGESVDLHLITSAGMAIARGPVGTRAGGPVFLSDGFAVTSFAFNGFGRGHIPYRAPDGSHLYEVGETYESTALRSVQQWLGDSIFARTGNGFGGEGALVAGTGACLPGGNSVEGPTGIQFVSVNALGEGWRDMILGYYVLVNYDALKAAYDDLAAATSIQSKTDKPFTFPTVDIYGPVSFAP